VLILPIYISAGFMFAVKERTPAPLLASDHDKASTTTTFESFAMIIDHDKLDAALTLQKVILYMGMNLSKLSEVCK
jgi:hypothetical protein